MALHPFLQSRINVAEKLIKDLEKKYEYVSILGSYTCSKSFHVNSKINTIDESEQDCGFTIKVYDGKHYAEYASNDILNLSADLLVKKLSFSFTTPAFLSVGAIPEEELAKSFAREDEHPLSDEIILTSLKEIQQKIADYDKRLVNVNVSFRKREVSKIFLSKKKKLDQYYTWINGTIYITSRDGENIKSTYTTENEADSSLVIEKLRMTQENAAKQAIAILSAEAIEPGEYEIITDPTISGLIAHEAFGHGVEVDMYVKERAKSRYFISQQVASSIVNMHDGAAATLSAASYFFDDDGVLAKDTVIIENGILKSGISDAFSALSMKQEPTGNGRRESFARKSYSRMTNTFFAPGKDKLENMISSVKHGYYLVQTDNGMEDPKNWQIQCTAAYGLEIKDGKFTGKMVAPVIISGYVLDLLHSISMVSEEWKVIGSGMCGKGYKEWVFVSDGGPYMKAKAKLA